VADDGDWQRREEGLVFGGEGWELGNMGREWDEELERILGLVGLVELDEGGEVEED
jgi:hypothetical protein